MYRKNQSRFDERLSLQDVFVEFFKLVLLFAILAGFVMFMAIAFEPEHHSTSHSGNHIHDAKKTVDGEEKDWLTQLAEKEIKK